MIPVAANHAGDVVDRDQLPEFVADVLPARNLFEDEKAHFVAGIEEMGMRRNPEFDRGWSPTESYVFCA